LIEVPAFILAYHKNENVFLFPYNKVELRINITRFRYQGLNIASFIQKGLDSEKIGAHWSLKEINLPAKWKLSIHNIWETRTLLG
jgi:hypothetical protein